MAELLYGKSNKSVDHIDRNGLNNVVDNLRYATNSIQGHNRGEFIHNTSGIKGVQYYKPKNKWRAVIKHLGKFYQKQFDTFEEAVTQRQAWEKEFYS